MTASKEILKLVPTFQALNLASKNYPKKKKVNIVKQGVENIVGTSLIKETAQFISFVD